ncbi:MAG: AraC family transcriptional regulator [Bacteroidota bacterium]
MIGLHNIPHFEGIEAYNRAINTPVPQFKEVDVRRFEDNMNLVPNRMEPFRTTFFQVSVVMKATGKLGQNTLVHQFEECTLFFNIPGQILNWDIVPDWSGFYASFKSDIIAAGINNPVFLTDFPFLKMGTQKFFSLNQQEALTLFELFGKMHYEYSNPSLYNKAIIQSYLSIVLQYGKRFFERDHAENVHRRATSPLSQRFEEVLESMFKPLNFGVEVQQKSISDIADELFVTPKHLSDVLKKETGFTGNQLIQKKTIESARHLLTSTTLTVTEIAYQLGFDQPAYFTRLFKKHEEMSPVEFRNRS